jgi:hypothetical protein
MNIKWGISQIKRTEVDKVALLVDWFCKVNSDTDLEVQYGEMRLAHKDPSAPNFVPFEDLTEQQVLNWVHGQVDKVEVETRLAAIIHARQNPTLISEVPWATVAKSPTV